MDRGAWRAVVHSVAQSQTLLKRLSTHTRTYTHISTYVKKKKYTHTHTVAEAKALKLWPPDAKSWLIGKDPDPAKIEGREWDG